MDSHLLFSAFTGRRLHLGVCGSVACVKSATLLRAWVKAGLSVSVTLTEAATQFVSPLLFESLGASTVYTRMFPPQNTFDHLIPGDIAAAFVIAPASATTLARLAQGLADEILSAQVLAYPHPLVIAPAMNCKMWQNSATQANVQLLQERGHHFILPESGLLACGDTGSGRLAQLDDIYLLGLKALAPQDMAGKKVMVTLGPTREAWDAVRFWTNPSTGTMGASLAVAAWLRGAEVHAVCGPQTPWLPEGITRYPVNTTLEMFATCDSLWEAMDFGIFTAAVADFMPESYGEHKFKKSDAAKGFSVQFLPTIDILQTLGLRKHAGQKIMGFAAETDKLQENMMDKLGRKNADMIVGNLIGQEGAGFAAATNRVCVADARGMFEEWPCAAKPDIAWRALEWLLRL